MPNTGKHRGWLLVYELQFWLLICIFVSPLAQAHHSSPPGSFQTDLVQVDATIVKFRYANPHARLEYDIKREGGSTERWVTVTHSVNVLKRRGIERDLLKTGDTVKISGWPSVRDENFMRIQEVQLADQRVARFWGKDMGVYVDSSTVGASQSVISAAVNKEFYDFTGGASLNFSGMWVRAFFRQSIPEPPFNDTARARIAKFDPHTDDPVLTCVPGGFPRQAGNPYPMEIIHHPDAIYMLYEAGNSLRRIYLDGRNIPEDASSSVMGYSVGSWEGDELVVTTKRLNENIITGLGAPLSEHAVITERWGFVDPAEYVDTGSPTARANGNVHQKLLRTEVYVEDSVYYDEPFSTASALENLFIRKSESALQSQM